MRVLPVALAVSAALHGGAIAWGLQHETEDTQEQPEVTLAPIEIVPATPAEPEPLVVALLPDHSVVPTAPAASASRHTRPTGNTRQITATEPAATTVLAPPSEPAPGSRHPLLSMRRPSRDTAPPAVPTEPFTERFLARSKPLAPRDIRTEQLQSELASAQSQLKNARWVANATPDQLTGARMTAMALRDELYHRELQPDGTGTKSEHETFRIKVAADGTAKIEDKANVQRKGLLGGSFDATDAIMRSQGVDPYASYKLKVLDETREERVAIGKRYRTQQLARSRQLVQKHLVALWSSAPDLAARKQALFELWDDCAETGSDELVAAGSAARAHVVGFIRSKLPAGGADAFTREELVRFNGRRKSRAAFAPY